MAYTTIDKHSSHFEISQWAGDGGTQNITNHNFQPDRILLKSRATGDGWTLQDSVRGFGSTTKLSPYDTSGPNDSSGGSWGNYGYLSQALTNGFTTVAGSNPGQNNKSGNNYVGYSQLAGGTAPTQTYTVKVVSDSGNKYRFDDFGTSAVTLDLQEGGTYTFDSSDSTVNSHPFVLGTSSGVDGSYDTGVTYKLDGVTKTYSQYTSGFSSASSRQLIITVAASAPTLYYNCSVHSVMGGAINTNSTFGSSNFKGTLQTKVSSNTAAGFSIVTWAGATGGSIGHGLGGTPGMWCIKNLSSNSSNHIVYHRGCSSGYFLKWNLANAQDNANNYMTSQDADKLVFTGSNHAANSSGSNFVGYFWREIPGFSRMGRYQGNGSTNGTYVFCGFKPRVLMIKRLGSSDEWRIYDDQREDFDGNQISKTMYPSTTTAEANDTGSGVDFLSNGFKMRSSSVGANGSESYAFWAIGQTQVSSNNIPSTAF